MRPDRPRLLPAQLTGAVSRASSTPSQTLLPYAQRRPSSRGRRRGINESNKTARTRLSRGRPGTCGRNARAETRACLDAIERIA
jgi:hypothetical protein